MCKLLCSSTHISSLFRLSHHIKSIRRNEIEKQTPQLTHNRNRVRRFSSSEPSIFATQLEISRCFNCSFCRTLITEMMVRTWLTQHCLFMITTMAGKFLSFASRYCFCGSFASLITTLNALINF